MADFHDFGKQAEQYVTEKYRKKDYSILERNWYFNHAEVDIIALKNNELIIVEVKARSSDSFSQPENAVTTKKKKLLVMAAQEYLLQNNLDLEVRFDVVSVVKLGNRLKAFYFLDAFRAHEI